MCCYWERYKERFEDDGLVIGSSKEEVGLGCWDGAGYEWYDGGVGDVEGCVDREDI